MENAQKKLRLYEAYGSWDNMPPEIKYLVLRNTDALTIMRLARDNPQSTSTVLATQLDSNDNVWKAFLKQDFPFENARPELHVWAQRLDDLIQGYLQSNPKANVAKEKLYPGRPHKQLYIIVRTWYGVLLETLQHFEAPDNEPVLQQLESIYESLEPDLETGRYPNNRYNRSALQSFMVKKSRRWLLPWTDAFLDTSTPLIRFGTVLDFIAYITTLENFDAGPIQRVAIFFQMLNDDPRLKTIALSSQQYQDIGFNVGSAQNAKDLKSKVGQILTEKFGKEIEQVNVILSTYAPEPKTQINIEMTGLVLDALFYSLPARDEETGALRYIVSPIGRKAQHKKWRSKYKGKLYWHGDNRYRIAPGTKRGDSYCARSWGIIQKHGRTPKNMLSRKKWKCRGKKSIKGAMPMSMELLQCAHCGASDPQRKCGQCMSVAYCNQECANAHADSHFE